MKYKVIFIYDKDVSHSIICKTFEEAVDLRNEIAKGIELTGPASQYFRMNGKVMININLVKKILIIEEHFLEFLINFLDSIIKKIFYILFVVTISVLSVNYLLDLFFKK